MEKIVFTDGTKICLLDENGKRTEKESVFISNYKENARRILVNRDWKNTGMGAQLRGDYSFDNPYEGENSPAYLNGVTFTNRENVVAYSFTVGQSSGIYYKDFSRETNDETHLIHSNSMEFLSLSFQKKGTGMLATTRKNGDVCHYVALFSSDGDSNVLTDGDSKDENASYSPVNGKILFNSSGVGRNGRGDFVMYGASAIYSLDPLSLDMDILKEKKDVSYIKPKQDGEGNLYAIKSPVKERIKGNPFLEILLIPVRIIEAIVGLVQFFVVAFSGKSLVSGKGGGGEQSCAGTRNKRNGNFRGRQPYSGG